MRGRPEQQQPPAHAGVWQLRLERLLHVRLPAPLPHDLAVKHAVLLLVAGFAVQQLSGQLWRVFVSGVSGQVSLMRHTRMHAQRHVLPVAVRAAASCLH